MKHPKVSVIVPAYNSEKYIANCIESVLAQTYKDFELIIVNDGSIDNTLSIVLKYKEEHSCIIVIDKPNSGVSDTRNKGITASKGEYIMFLDSDDTLSFDYIERHINALSCDVEMVISKMWPTDCVDQYCKTGTYNELYPDRKIPWAFPGCKLFKADIIKINNIHFDVNMRLCEDWIFSMDYIKYINKIAIIDYMGYQWNTDNSDSLSRGCSYEYRIEAYEVAISHLQSLHRLKGIWDPSCYHNIKRDNMRNAIRRMYVVGGTNACLRRKRIDDYFDLFGTHSEKKLNRYKLLTWIVDQKLMLENKIQQVKIWINQIKVKVLNLVRLQ